ncbi:HpcH/HpaI aldolase family protein [Paenibacillus beijingensis]|uniref:HpcH/HpaI aldolase/citrate lyase domain-containing protein n=1 Tax=Paenibacillus beijingensis TaxID=1126833 RepID=A0A0D5NIZ4_9BACL|nr:aldolase/citrate lyase family protein [Paenibacillus beijingensis]AJY75085.1 hypothetical protein VN24_11480 [Paenibacillus beijingensis]
MHQPMEDLKRKLGREEVVVGTCVSLGDMMVSELLGYAGCDFLWIDMEHSANDKQQILRHIVAARAGKAAAFIRIPWNDPILVKPILDMGPDGIIFPFIRSAQEAEQAVLSSRYPPRGIRGFGPNRANGYGAAETPAYLAQADDLFRIIQIEHIDAVNSIEEICQVEGIDCLMFGSMDLSGSLGRLGETDTPEFIEAVDRVVAAAGKHNKMLGCCIGYSQETIAFFLDRGIKVFTCGMDSYMLRSYTEQMVLDVRTYAKSLSLLKSE